MTNLADLLVVLHLISTLSMVGLIWFVQVVHYPLMRCVGEGEFREYEQEPQRRTTLVVAPLMLTEAFTSVAMVWQTPQGVSLTQCALGGTLLAVVWLSTWLRQAPLHRKLEDGLQPDCLLYTSPSPRD